MPKTKLNLEQRFWVKVNKRGPKRRGIRGRCWIWTAALTDDGYGEFNVNGTMVRAHRFAWESKNGPMPKGFELHHKCERKTCIRLSHIKVVTKATHPDNGAAKNRSKKRCPEGHLYSKSNTLIESGRRRCRICGRAKTARYQAKCRGAK